MILVAQWVLNQPSASLQRNQPLAVHLFCLLACWLEHERVIVLLAFFLVLLVWCSLCALKQYSLTQTLATSMQSNCVDFVYYCKVFFFQQPLFLRFQDFQMPASVCLISRCLLHSRESARSVVAILWQEFALSLSTAFIRSKTDIFENLLGLPILSFNSLSLQCSIHRTLVRRNMLKETSY